MGEYMTKESYDRLKEKLDELKKKRPRISKAIGEAREHGDLRENSAYHAAREEQGLNEARIRELEANLESVEITEEAKIPKKDSVALNSNVRIKAMDTGEEFEYKIVSDMEADIFQKMISNESPVGSALMYQKKGAMVEVEVPRGLVKYKILEIK